MQIEVNNSIKHLRKGNSILYPTDTVWGIGCDATNPQAIEKVFSIKKRSESNSLIILVDSVEMLNRYLEKTPDNIDTILFNKRPTTIIYKNPINLSSNVVASDNTVAIRIVQDEFCKNLIHKFGKPIVSTSANMSGSPTPNSFKEIEPAILENVDYSVNLHRNKICNAPSKILKINFDGSITTIRE